MPGGTDIETAVTEGAVLVGICPTCSEVRLRSKTPIFTKTDCRPENFVGVDGAPDPTGEVPLCYKCSAVLTFTRGSVLQPRPRAPKSEAQKIAEAQTPSVPTVLVETIFAPTEDEAIITIDRIGNTEFVVVTTKRLVRIRY